MLVEPMYYAIFYDVAFPKNDKYAMKKRINYFKYLNLTDDVFFNKEVELDKVKYRILSHSTFTISNTVDNHLFVICDVEKIK